MEEENPYLYTSLFSLLLLSSYFEAAAGSHCPSFSCGRLHNLGYPFRRKGDPSECGRPDYELNCEVGDEAVIHIGAADYYVTDVIHYPFRLRLVDPNLVNGTCHLPSQPPLLHRDLQSEFFFDTTFAVCFVSCREEIHAENYVPVPCPNPNDTSFSYAVVGFAAYLLSNLQRSCKSSGCVPVLDGVSSSDYALLENTSVADIYLMFQKGFVSYTNRLLLLSEISRHCQKEALRCHISENY